MGFHREIKEKRVFRLLCRSVRWTISGIAVSASGSDIPLKNYSRVISQGVSVLACTIVPLTSQEWRGSLLVIGGEC